MLDHARRHVNCSSNSERFRYRCHIWSVPEGIRSHTCISRSTFSRHCIVANRLSLEFPDDFGVIVCEVEHSPPLQGNRSVTPSSGGCVTNTLNSVIGYINERGDTLEDNTRFQASMLVPTGTL